MAGRLPRRGRTRRGDQRGRVRPRRGQKGHRPRDGAASPANSPRRSGRSHQTHGLQGNPRRRNHRHRSGPAPDLPFGVADLSLAPTPAVGDSVGEIFQSVGLSSIGAPGSTAVLAMLNDAVKKGGAFASSHVGGLSGAFIPVSEDSSIEAATRSGALTLEKLEAMTSVCSVGLDMIAIPGDTPAATISGIIADEMAIGMINSKTTAVRVIPVPGKGVGDKAASADCSAKPTSFPCPAATPPPLSNSADVFPRRSTASRTKGNWGREGEPFWRKVPPPFPKPHPSPSQDFHLCSRPPHRFSAIAKLSVPAGPFGFTGFF